MQGSFLHHRLEDPTRCTAPIVVGTHASIAESGRIQERIVHRIQRRNVQEKWQRLGGGRFAHRVGIWWRKEMVALISSVDVEQSSVIVVVDLTLVEDLVLRDNEDRIHLIINEG